MLRFAKTVEKQMWDFEHPLKQHPLLKPEVVAKLDNRNVTLDKLREMDGKEIGHLIHHVSMGNVLKRAAEEIPTLDIEVSIQPITRTVLRVRLVVEAKFRSVRTAYISDIWTFPFLSFPISLKVSLTEFCSKTLSFPNLWGKKCR